MKSFKEVVAEAKAPSKDVAYVYKKSGSPKSNFSTRYKKGDYLQYSHMGSDQALMTQVPMFVLMQGDKEGIYKPTGTVFSIPMKDVKDSGKKFVQIEGPSYKYYVK